MSYSAPIITAAGLTIPTYVEIRDDLLDQYRTIYGQDVYLREDSADYQWISIVALRIYDAMQSIQLCYNNRAPQTAIGSGLDQIVKMNGIARKLATNSTAIVTITGLAGTVITNGVVTDTGGYKWDLPATVTIGIDGTVDVTATCQTIGSISALENTITSIYTPVAGWTSVNNVAAATLGEPIETDVGLRARQSLSVTAPSMNLLTGTWSAIAAMEDVTRYNVVENYTNEYDADGTPPHSITCVVEGGTSADIAETIWKNRGLGCLTNGDVHENITDPISGIVTAIGFYRPTYVPIYATLTIEGFTALGYTTTTKDDIQQAIVDYLNALQIGADVTISALYAAAMAATEDIHNPKFSIWNIAIAKVPSPQEQYDVTILFNEVAQGVLINIEIVDAF